MFALLVFASIRALNAGAPEAPKSAAAPGAVAAVTLVGAWATPSAAETSAVAPLAQPEPTVVAPTAEPTPTPAPAVALAPPRVEPEVVAVAKLTQPAPVEAPAAPDVANKAPERPERVVLEGILHQQQTWNNCGPANLSMLLTYLGSPEKQRDAARFLKPMRDDKNVSPNEMVAYAEQKGFRARWIVGADLSLLRGFVAAGIPVIAESWYIPHPNDEMGHYELVHGYDGGTLIVDDSYEGPNQQLNADEWDALWKVFNRTLIVVWKPEQDAQVAALLGERNDPKRMVALALEAAKREVEANPNDKFAWFNIGTNLLTLGDPAGATTAFEKAESLKLPWRMLWYQHGPYEAFYLTGNYDQVLKLANRSLKAVGDLEESYYWRGRALAGLGKKSEARRDYATALKLNANYAAAAAALK
jgi:tetratricopeptide (TPR) repeat protein